MGARLAAAAAAMAILAVAAAASLPFVSDDALISLRYADRLLDGDGLTWNDGERVEGYSNLLWIVVCAALGGLGLDLVLAARLAGFAGFAAALLALFRAFPGGGARGILPAATGALALALSGPIAVWTVGGLEQPLLAALLAWAAAAGLRAVIGEERPESWVAPGLLLAGLCWTRPDGPLFTVGFCCGLLAARGIGRDTLALAARFATLPVAAWVAQTAFRRVYYGEWVSNSALAKLALSGDRLSDGLGYVGAGLAWSAPVVLSALALAFLPGAGTPHRRRVAFLLPTLVLWLAYVATVGGDSFPARRHLVPALVLLAFLLASGVEDRLRSASIRSLAAAVVVLLGAIVATHAFDPQIRRARLERWEWDGEAAGRLLRTAFPPDTLVAVDPAGSVPFFSGLPALDMLGINDRYLARHPPEDFGHGPLGHELGDGAYVLEREPDLILFCGPAGGGRPCYRSGREMVADPTFSRLYRLTTLEAPEPRPFTFQPWVRIDSPRIGIRREGDRVSVPAHLLMATGRSVARPDPEGTLVVELTPQFPAGFAALALAPGTWRLFTEPAADVRVSVAPSGAPARRSQGVRDALIRLDATGPATVDVLLETTAGAVPVARLVAVREGP